MSLGYGLRISQFRSTFSPLARKAAGALWLQDDSLAQSAGLVTTWVDKYGNFPAATVVTTAPTYTASSATFGGKPCATYLHATEQRLDLLSFSISQPNTIYLVCSNTANGIVLIDGSVTRQNIGTNGSNVATFFAGGSAQTTTASLADGLAHILIVQWNGASSKLFIDSSQTANFTGNPGSNGLSGLWIGNNGVSFAPTGGIAALNIMPGIDSSAQQAQMVAYYASRYGKTWS